MNEGPDDEYKRSVFYLSDGTGITAETFGSALLSQFDGIALRPLRLPFVDSPLCVAVVESPKDSPKVPALEQTYSAGAVCLALLNAALASGWGANWLTGWVAHDAVLAAGVFGLEPQERIAGFVHIGTETNPPPDRPRPDLDAIVRWMDA